MSVSTDDFRTGSNKLYGEAGDDVLISTEGPNLLDSGADADTCYGRVDDTLVSCEH